MTALNPMQSIGHQIAEAIRLHKNLSDDEATQRVAALLRDVGLSGDGVTADRFPHELSGGQRQRVVVAMAIALRPKLVIADEPTTALDVSTQREILSLLRRLASQYNIAILLITHDRGVAAEIADRIAIIEDGAIRRVGTPEELLQEKISPLISAEISKSEVQNAIPLLAAENLTCDYDGQSIFGRGETKRAVDDVSIQIHQGDTIALIGESGCGKSTLARTLMGLHKPTTGAIKLNGELFPARKWAVARSQRKEIQIVFQDPYSSFNLA